MSEHKLKEVAEFEIGGGILFNNSVNDIVVERSENPPLDDVTNVEPEEPAVEIPVEPADPAVNTSEPEENEDPEEDVVNTPPVVEPVNEDPSTDKYEDYTQAAMFATALNQTNPGLFSDIDKDLDPRGFVEKLNEYLNNQVETIKQNVSGTYEEANEYLELILNSSNQQQTSDVIKQAASYDKWASLNVTDDTPVEDLEAAVRSELLYKEVDEDIVEITISDLKDTGKLAEKAAKSVEFHKQVKNTIIAREKAQQEEYLRQQEFLRQEQEKQFNSLVDSGNLSGIQLSKQEQADFKKWMTEEVIVSGTDQTGKPVKYRSTKSAEAVKDFNQNLEKVLAFQKLLMDGFDFSKIINQGKLQRDNEILDILEGKNTRKQTNTKTSKNAYYNMGKS